MNLPKLIPEQFAQFEYLLEVIRKFVFVDYLKTKEHCLKWYCRNIFTTSPYKYDIPMYMDNYFNDEYSDGKYHYHRYIYNVKTLSYYLKDNYTNNILETKELSENDIFILLSEAKEEDIKRILTQHIEPSSKMIKDLIEKEYGRSIYPLNKNLLLEFASYQFILQFRHLFENEGFAKHIEEKLIIIKNNSNDQIIKIPKTLFELYCGINNSIKDFDNNDIITVPFEFKYRAKVFLEECIVAGKFVNSNMNINRINENDFLEFHQLISFLQISFDDK